MDTTIKKAASAGKTDSLIMLVKGVKGFNGHESLTKDEADYIKKNLSEKRRTLTFNKLDRIVILQDISFDKGNSRNLEECRKAGDMITGVLNKHNQKSAAILDLSGNSALTLAVAEGMMLSNYQFLKYKRVGKADPNSLKSIAVVSDKTAKADIEKMEILCTAVCKARDLVNEPLSFLTATELSNQFKKMGKEAGFTVEVWDKKKIIAKKMGGLLSVNLGSIDPPTFSIMEYKPKGAVNKKPYVLVGKGVVYDTGGLSLKPTANSMDFMKSDMAGSAVVSASLYAIAKAKLKVHVIALVPATDNRPDGNAYVPGDVIEMMSGHTVEVLNTDAEGRMILADALHYAKKYKPELVMDFATLTGAAAAAVGQYGIVCMGTADEKQKSALKVAGENAYERLAEFPFWDEYDDLIKSDIADMKNVGGPYGGAITAGKFLQRYTDYPWMHFDIAGSSFIKAVDSYRGKNGTGFGVRMLFDFFSNLK